MSRLVELSASISSLSEELGFAREDLSKAVAALINAPGNPDVRAAVRTAEINCAELETNLKHLQGAMALARQRDQSDEAKAIRAKGLDHLHQAEKLVALRNEAADALDNALVVLNKAVKAWVATSGALKSEAVGFYRIAFEGNQHAILTRIIDIGGLERVILNTLLVRLEEALRGINPGSQIALSFTSDVNDPTPLAVNDSKKNGANLIAIMQGTAETRGLLVESEKTPPNKPAKPAKGR
jgi:hypothetical protein